MRRHGYLARRAGAVLFAMLALGATVTPASSVRAQPGPLGGQGVTGPGCVVKGTYPFPKGTVVYDAAGGGRVIATFTGATQGARLSDFPADPTAGRARIFTGAGGASLRLEGFADASALPVFTTRDVAVHPGHVWISAAQKVRLVGAASGQLTGELAVLGTSGQTVRAAATCDAYTLEPGRPLAAEVPGNGRGYVTKTGALELFDDPTSASPFFSLRVVEGASHLFWSTETRGAFVRIKNRGDLTIDAWARARDLEPLKKGEMMDQFIAPSHVIAGAQLAMDRAPKLIVLGREVPLRGKRDDKEKVIGAVEAGAEVYLTETVAGWGNVLPKHLGFLPPDDGGFWIAPADLPK